MKAGNAEATRRLLYLDFGPRLDLQIMRYGVFDDVFAVNVTHHSPASEILLLQTVRASHKTHTITNTYTNLLSGASE